MQLIDPNDGEGSGPVIHHTTSTPAPVAFVKDNKFGIAVAVVLIATFVAAFLAR